MNVVIFGANSLIAQNLADLYAAEEATLYLVGRNANKLNHYAADLRLRTQAQVFTEVKDLNKTDDHGQLLAHICSQLNSLDCVILAHGLLGEQQSDQEDYKKQQDVFQSNFLSQASLLTEVSKKMIQQKHGTIGVITSVAGDRGRKKNYVYGAAKGALSIYLSGLRGRLDPYNIAVCEHKLGFVDTPMTVQFKKGPLWADAHSVGKKIKKQLSTKSDICYIPFFWRLIMAIIKGIPERIFKKLNI